MSRSPSRLPSRSYNSVTDFQKVPSSSSISGNDGCGGWIIQKFGGTSVGKFPENIVDNIVKVYSETNRVAIVCSARSSQTKSEGTTSRLLKSAELAEDNQDYTSLLQVIEDDHVQNAQDRIKMKKLNKN